MCPSEPQSSVHSEVAVVKQLVLNQIDKKLKDLRTLKQHYYPEGGWGWVILTVSLCVQMLVHGMQFALAMYVNLVVVTSEKAVARNSNSRANVVARRLVYGVEQNASKNKTVEQRVRAGSCRRRRRRRRR